MANAELRRYVADTLAMIIFSTVCGILVEVVIAGLTLQQSLKVRFAAIPVMLLAARPYGVYRDWLFKLTAGNTRNAWKATLVDTVANVTFQIPLYVSLLALNGAKADQIMAAVGTIFILTAVTGRPYGVFLSLCRRLIGVTARQS